MSIQRIEIFPRIEIEFETRYLSVNSTNGIILTIWLHESKEKKIDITTLASIYTLDKNVTVRENIVYPSYEGSAIVKAAYNGLGASVQFVVYNSFFKDNYEMHLLPNIDRINIQSNKPMKALFDTLFEFYDILYAYQNDIVGIKNAKKIKAKFLNTLFSSFGFPEIDFENENSALEALSNEIYRNLLDNFLDILEIRGTQAAYELFFGALGYDIEIFEFWFDENENLVEINTTDPALSTFDTYDITGHRLDESAQRHIDPRPFVVPKSVHTKNNKSKYIRVKYSKNDNLPSSYIKSHKLLKKYLDFLIPNHLEYLSELIAINTDGDIINYCDNSGETITANKINSWGGGSSSIPQLFQPTGRYLYALGEAALGLFQFSADGQIILAFASAEYSWTTSSYFYESNGQSVEFYGEADNGIYRFISTGEIAEFTGIAETHFKLKDFDPRLQGLQIGSSIHWYDYITLQDRIGLNAGWIAHYPADMFARDYNTTPARRTYSEILSYALAMTLEDTIQTIIRFDTGWSYDDGVTAYDLASFLDAGAGGFYAHRFQPNEIENYYIGTKDTNPQLPGEDNAIYEARIRAIVLNHFKNLGGHGFDLHPDILAQIISNI